METKAESKIRVYLVEDHNLVRESLRTMLELEPTVEMVGEAGEAEHALEQMDLDNVDVVLMDIRLPGMDGIEATRHLKERRPDLAVVILTSYRDEYIGPAFEAGATGYLLKTCTRQQLIETVRAASQGRQYIDQSLTSEVVRELSELRRTQRESLLTERQLQIIRLIANGVRYREIADTLFISLSTVNREVRQIFDQLGVSDVAQAVSEAHKRRLL